MSPIILRKLQLFNLMTTIITNAF